MAHTHVSKTVASVYASHVHLLAGGAAISCSTGLPIHTHPIDSGANNSHLHDVSFDLLSANLGSPNWWAHIHGVNVSLVANGGGAHNSHAFTITRARGCSFFDPACYDDPHTHTVTVSAEGNGGASHTHTVASITCSAADPSGTPEAHTHLVTMTLVATDGHTHTVTCTVGYTACHFGNSHKHTPNVTTASTTHPHYFSSYSSSGGESLPTAKGFMDGFVCVE